MSIFSISGKIPTINGSAISPAPLPTPWKFWSAAGIHSGILNPETSVCWVDPSNTADDCTAKSISIPLMATATYQVPSSWTSAGMFIPPTMQYPECSGFVINYEFTFSMSGRATAEPTEGRWMAQPYISPSFPNVAPYAAPVYDIRWTTTAMEWVYRTNLVNSGSQGKATSAGQYARRWTPTVSGAPMLFLKAGPTATGVRTTAYFEINSLSWSASGYIPSSDINN